MALVSIRNRVAGIHSKQPWFVLSAADHYDLIESDTPAISHFYSFKANPLNGMTFAVPDGCVDIVFDCDDAGPSAKVCGTTLEARSAELKQDHLYFGVRFSLGMVPDFLDVSAEGLVDHELSFLDAVKGSKTVFDQVVSEREFAGRVTVLRNFLRDKNVRRVSRLSLEVVQAICEAKGDIRVHQLRELTGFCTRTLQRQFHRDLGMSPKAFSRIIRCQSAIYDINHRDSVAFSDLACDLGFSDQSHFLREFKRFVSATPLEYQQQVRQKTYLERIRYC
ncbi:helix-turn-helix domain-containing protein [Marinobacter oulmenensis]|uniref:AraC-like DNA-binding protein n=1 Tax=Marinobacter oulmenensis TaxID=643747 RepID=A0A840UMR6_9GAMM|nr:helix-turn-helix domain-containing protein [Marinobacter oulmenensis]MBB5321948.1 AraC-like DNA-binding protein [Marinobacter oulmenensis]